MLKRTLISFLTLALTVLTIDRAQGQVTAQPFSINNSDTATVDVDQVVIKGDNKSYVFKMDTASVDYKSLSKIDANWIKKVEILKGEELHGGGTKTVMMITLKKGKVKALPVDMRAKFE